MTPRTSTLNWPGVEQLIVKTRVPEPRTLFRAMSAVIPVGSTVVDSFVVPVNPFVGVTVIVVVTVWPTLHVIAAGLLVN